MVTRCRTRQGKSPVSYANGSYTAPTNRCSGSEQSRECLLEEVWKVGECIDGGKLVYDFI